MLVAGAGEPKLEHKVSFMAVQVGDFLRASATFANNDNTDKYANVFHWRVDTLVNADDTAVANDLEQELEALYTTISGSISIKLIPEEVTVINATRDEFVAVQQFSFGFAGAGEYTPPQVAALVIGRTQKPRVQGRKYIPMIPEGINEDGNLTAASLVEFDAFAARFVSPLDTPATGNAYTPGVCKYQGPIAVEFNAFKEAKVIRGLRTQRRRTIGRGS